MIEKMLGALFLAVLFLPLSPARAATCTVSPHPLNFSAVDTLSAAGGAASTDIGISCTDVASDTVVACINLGAGDGGSQGAVRLMTSSSNTGSKLEYRLYADAGTTPWGGNQNLQLGEPYRVTVSASDGTAEGSATIHGMVEGNQANIATGAYASHFTEADVVIDYSENSAFDCSNPAGALQTTASFDVSASVDANCLIQADDIDFGSVGMITKDISATGALHVTCTPGASYAIAMGNGLYYDGSTRRMRSANGDFVSYGLYQQEGGLQAWGNNRGVDTVDGTATGSDDKTIYGIVSPQPAVPGSYDDQVVVTITYN